VLDSGAVVEYLLPNQPDHRQWTVFFRGLGSHQSLVVYSELLVVELYDVLFNLALKERWGKGAAHSSHRYDGRVRRRAARLLNEGRESWEEFLSSVPSATIEVARVSDQVPELMRHYGMRSNDAVHVATCDVVEIPLLATPDHGFARVPERRLNLITAPSRVRTMRRRRAETTRRTSRTGTG
jgi:predicted nucleic acid-binding protein